MILVDFAIFVVNIPTVKEYRKLNLSEEQGERFYQDIKTMEVIRHSRSFWDRVGYDHLVILLAVPR
jgi:hypothetical protein